MHALCMRVRSFAYKLRDNALSILGYCLMNPSVTMPYEYSHNKDRVIMPYESKRDHAL